MQTTKGAEDERRTKGTLPRWLLVAGWCVLPGALLLAMRLTFERTVLTWVSGPQMVGFALAHSVWILPLMAFAAAAHVWLVVAVPVAILRARQSPPARSSVLLLAAVALSIGSIWLPSGAWSWVTFAVAGPGPHGSKQLSHSASLGELSAVRMLVARGVPLDEPGEMNALRGAATAGEVQVVDWLLRMGADVNRQGGFRNRTALHDAASMGRTEVVRRLLDAGANPRLLDDEGKAPADLANAGSAGPEIAKILREAGAPAVVVPCAPYMPTSGPIPIGGVEVSFPEGLQTQAWGMNETVIYGASAADARVTVTPMTIPGGEKLVELPEEGGMKRFKTAGGFAALMFPASPGEARRPPPQRPPQPNSMAVKVFVSVGGAMLSVEGSALDEGAARALARAVADGIRQPSTSRPPTPAAEPSAALLRCFTNDRESSGEQHRRRICFRPDGSLERHSQRSGPVAGIRNDLKPKSGTGAWKLVGDQLVLCEPSGHRLQAHYRIAGDELVIEGERWVASH